MRQVFDRLPDLVLVLNPTATHIVDVNEDGAAALGWTADQMIGERLHQFCTPEDPTPPSVRQQASMGKVVSFDRFTLRGDGTFENYNFVGVPMANLEKYVVMIGRPMDRLLASDSKLSDLLKLADLASDGFVVTDSEGRVQYCNQAASNLVGLSKPLGQSIHDFLRVDEEYRSKMHEVLKTGSGEIRGTVIRSDGTTIPIASRAAYDQETDHWYSVVRDISETVINEKEMSALNEALQVQASTDWLTGLANRSALEHELERAGMAEEPFTVLMLDIDDFKSVNDTFGHAAGDEFLRAIANRLRNTISDRDFIARLGGDEFVVMLDNTSRAQAVAVAERIIGVLREPYSVGGRKMSRSCSLGIATFDPTNESAAVLRHVDRALYKAKALGRNQYVVYDEARMSDASDSAPNHH